MVKNPSAMQQPQGMQFRSLGWKDSLEEEMATHSCIFAWEILWTEEPGGLWSMGGHIESDTTEQLNTCSLLYITGELNCTDAISQGPLPLASRYIQSMGAPAGGRGAGGKKSEFFPVTCVSGSIFGHGYTSSVAAAPPGQPPVGGTKLEGRQQGGLGNAFADQPVVHGPDR